MFFYIYLLLLGIEKEEMTSTCSPQDAACNYCVDQTTQCVPFCEKCYVSCGDATLGGLSFSCSCNGPSCGTSCFCGYTADQIWRFQVGMLCLIVFLAVFSVVCLAFFVCHKIDKPERSDEESNGPSRPGTPAKELQVPQAPLKPVPDEKQRLLSAFDRRVAKHSAINTTNAERCKTL